MTAPSGRVRVEFVDAEGKLVAFILAPLHAVALSRMLSELASTESEWVARQESLEFSAHGSAIHASTGYQIGKEKRRGGE